MGRQLWRASSKNRMKGSRRESSGLPTDRFFHFFFRPPIFLSQVAYGIPCVESRSNYGGGNPSPRYNRPSERDCGINHNNFRFLPASLLYERIKDVHPPGISLDALDIYFQNLC